MAYALEELTADLFKYRMQRSADQVVQLLFHPAELLCQFCDGNLDLVKRIGDLRLDVQVVGHRDLEREEAAHDQSPSIR